MRGSLARQRSAFDALSRAHASRRDEESGGTKKGSVRDLDPVRLVRRYADPEDQEVAGLFAALFAYGRVEHLCRTVDGILSDLGRSPAAGLREGLYRAPGWARGFRYRFNSRADLLRLCAAVGGMREDEGGLGLALARRREPGGDLPGALRIFAADLRRRAGRSSLSPGLRFLLADPALGGACKRWWLYLRWMIRPDDGCDLGTWSTLFSPSELLVPLDAHWIRIGPRLGLTSRRTPGRRMAEEITEALRRIRPEDPLRYDYAVCHLGIEGGCPVRLTPADCAACGLRAVCPRRSNGSA